MTPTEARNLGCAYFNNRYGVRRLCFTFNPQLWPGARIYNQEDVTCPGCIEMLARRVERILDTCTLHGWPKPREDCDVCMQRGVWAGV